METVASLRDVHKRYGQVQALAGVDLDLFAGEVLAVLGSNGAGKTTAVASLLGAVEPDRGEARLFGQPPRHLPGRRRIGAMLQASGVPDTLRVGELLHLFAGYYPRPYPLAEVAAMAGIEALLDRRYAALSGGQQRSVQFALALVGRPDVLFLDEPTVGLDIEARQRFWQVIRDQVGSGCAVLLTTHYLEEAQALADRVVVLAHGRVLVEDTVAGLRARTGLRRIACRSRLLPADVAGWDGVVGAHVDAQGLLHLQSAHAETVLRRLLEADVGLAELEVQRAGLAETFVDLTREAA